MHAPDVVRLFQQLTFNKSATEIVEASKKKVLKIKAKIEERVKRVADLRKEYGIDDAALIQLFQMARKQEQSLQFVYNSSVPADNQGQMRERTIGAGVVNNILTENDFIESEKSQVERLELIIRNLKDVPRFSSNGTPIAPQDFSLSYTELEFLEF